MDLSEGFAPTPKITLTQTVHDSILEMIIKNPSDGEQVLNEKRLMELFGVSKAPVREALIRLCSEGVLRSVPRYGYVVVQMSEQDCRDMVKMRILLETEALKLSLPQLTDENLQELHEQIFRARAKQNVEVWDVWDDNEEFHLLLASFCRNKLLMNFLKECMQIQRRVYAQRVWNQHNSMADSVAELPHLGIFQRISDRDLEGACRLLENDITGALG